MITSWEKAIDNFVARWLWWSGRLVRPVNWVLADEKLVTFLWMPLLVLVSPGLVFAALVVIAVLSSPILEQRLKVHVGRGRPDDPSELGFPSGDCMLAGLIWPLMLGFGWGLAITLLVALFRILQRRHWLLDVLVGAGLGLCLSGTILTVSYLVAGFIEELFEKGGL